MSAGSQVGGDLTLALSDVWKSYGALRVLDGVEKLFARAVLFAIEIVSQSPATRPWRGARLFLLRELLGHRIFMCLKNHRLFAVLTIQNFLLAAIMATDKTTRPAHTQRI